MNNFSFKRENYYSSSGSLNVSLKKQKVFIFRTFPRVCFIIALDSSIDFDGFRFCLFLMWGLNTNKEPCFAREIIPWIVLNLPGDKIFYRDGSNFWNNQSSRLSYDQLALLYISLSRKLFNQHERVSYWAGKCSFVITITECNDSAITARSWGLTQKTWILGWSPVLYCTVLYCTVM